MSQTFQIQTGDVLYDTLGQPVYVSGKVKVGQDLTEATLIPTNDIGFGFNLINLVGEISDPSIVASKLDTNITRGLDRFITLQQQNQRLVRSDDELLSSVQSVQAGAFAPGNYTDFKFSYSVNTVAGDSLTKVGEITL